VTRRLRPSVLLALCAALLLGAAPAFAQEGDSASSGTPSTRIGDRFVVTLQVETEPGATVEVDPLAPTWEGVQLVSIQANEAVEQEGRMLHRLDLVMAAFDPGDLELTPAVLITMDGLVTRRELPSFQLSVLTTLPEGTAPVLIEAPVPLPIGGAQSPFLVPAVVASVAFAVVVLGFALYRLYRYVASRPPKERPPVEEEPSWEPGQLPPVEGLLTDPVAAYRALSATVRESLTSRYGFPARALTTRELVARMQDEGVDRWQARLVAGLLENCDSVVYAGYYPAPDRRRADLSMAEEILEGMRA
jgi:hypothetical protein